MLIKLTHAHVIGTVIAYLIGVCLVPLVISFSKKEGLVDVPNERKIHTKPISRIGGVAIWASTMLTFLCLVFMSYYPYGSLLSGILLGGSLMFCWGLLMIFTTLMQNSSYSYKFRLQHLFICWAFR